MIFLLVNIPITVRAESTLEKLQKAKNEKAKTQQEVGNAKDKKDSLQITKNSLLGQLGQLNDELQAVSDNLAILEEDIACKQKDIEDAQIALQEAIETEQTQYANMKLRIRQIYEQGDYGYLDLLFSSKSYGDFINKSDYIERLNRYDHKMLDEYKATKTHVEEVKAQLESELVELDRLEEETRTEQKRVSQLVQNTSKSVSMYSDQIKEAEETIDELENMLSKQDEDIASLQKQYEEELALSILAAQSAWRDISEITFEEGDRRLLANLIYCEAGAEPYEGQVAVGAVVINRMLSSRYPNTMIGVIYQRKQFSPVDNGRLAFALANEKATARCYKAADEAMSGFSNVGKCLYFRTPIPGLTGISIGGHIFY